MGLNDWGVKNIIDAYKDPNKAKDISIAFVGQTDAPLESILDVIGVMEKEDFDEKLKSLGLYNLEEACWDGYQKKGMKKGRKGNMVPNCVRVSEAKKKGKVNPAYLTKDASAMKKEIDRVKKLKSDDPSAYEKWDADYSDKGKTKKYKTKKSAATSAYEKRFGKKEK